MARKKGKRCSKNISGTSTGKASRKRERDMKFPKLTQRYVNVTQRVKHTQMKECLVKIFNSQFNRIFMNSGFSSGVKLESLREELTDKSTKHSVEDIAKEAGEVYNIFINTFSVAKDNEGVDTEFIQKIYETEFTFHELLEVAESLKKQIEAFLEEYGSKDASSSFHYTVWKHLKRQFPHHELEDHRCKFVKIIRNVLEAQQDPENADAFEIANIVIGEILAVGLNDFDENLTLTSSSLSPTEFEEFPLAAPEQGKFHDFECPGINHYYVATSQYYKMLLEPIPAQKPIQNKPNSVQSVEHISNPKTLEKYNAKKLAFKEAGKVNKEKKVKEMLLFHGTDAANIDSILKDGFNVNFNPKHKTKMQRYGRGIYVAEHPEEAFHYGNIILVCKVREDVT